MHLATDLNNLLDRMVKVPGIKNYNRQTIDTLISKETLLFVKYLKIEKKEWNPKIPNL